MNCPLATSLLKKWRRKTTAVTSPVFWPLSPWFDQLMPQADTLNVYRTYAAEDALFEEDALFGDEDNSPAVALVGTSYSADPQWNFEGALKQHLNTELSNFAQSAQGPLAPMNTFLEQQLNNLPELQVVIWEIPERYLLVGYPELYSEAHSNISRETVAGKSITSIHRLEEPL